MSYATLKDKARIVANGEGLTPTITFIVASDSAIATKRAAVQDLVQRLNKARLWSLDHLPEYAKNTAELTKLPEDVLLSAYTAQRTSPIVIDDRHRQGSSGSLRPRHPLRHPVARRSTSARPSIAALRPPPTRIDAGQREAVQRRRLGWIRRSRYPAATFGVGATFTASLP